MFGIYQQVVEGGLLNFMGAHIPVPTNLNIGIWSKLAVTPEEELVVSSVTYGFPVGYQGPVHSPSWENHALAKAHPGDVAPITTEPDHRVMLGQFDNHPSHHGAR